MKTKLWHQHIDSLYAVACEESKERKKDFFLRPPSLEQYRVLYADKKKSLKYLIVSSKSKFPIQQQCT